MNQVQAVAAIENENHRNDESKNEGRNHEKLSEIKIRF